MTLPRRLLLVFAALVSMPTALTWAQGAVWPERRGTLTEREALPSVKPLTSTQSYRAPQSAGTPHDLSHRPYFGLGEPEARRWYGFGPTRGTKRPALVLLHGSGRDGRSMIDMWRALAERERIVLIAPDARDSRTWTHWGDGAHFMAALLSDAGSRYAIDPDRIYLFGHSAGGIFAGQLANLGFGPWRAVATHAGAPLRYTIVPARRPIPILTWQGDADPVHTPDRQKDSARALARAGHDVTLTTIRGHGHWYYDIGPTLAPSVWRGLERAD